MPVGKDDAARCERLALLGLPALKEAEYPEIAGLVAMAGKMFDVSHAVLIMHDRMHQFFKFAWRCEEARGLSQLIDTKSAVCNYPLLCKQVYVVRDARCEFSMDSSNPDLTMSRFPFYAGAPCIAADGIALCVLCVMDSKPRHDFSASDERQLEVIAMTIARQLELIEVRRRNAILEFQQRTVMSQVNSFKRQPPTESDEITFVYTDVQGSTSIWEIDPASMSLAIRLHDSTIRESLARHNGYEITTEGDAFHIAFHDAVDAVAFCLDVQTELTKCDWPKAILASQHASSSTDGAWRGLRVRMGVHTGCPDSVRKHDMTGRVCYAGLSVAMAEAIQAVCHGGQILVSAETLSQMDSMLTQLGSPQVIDLGKHILQCNALAQAYGDDTRVEPVRLFQLVPASLAQEFCGPNESSLKEFGRMFPAVPSLECVSPGFHDAPAGSSVTLCFVFVKDVKELKSIIPDSTRVALLMLRNCVRSLLKGEAYCGYECQEIDSSFMLAFPNMDDLIHFAANCQQALPRLAWPRELCDVGHHHRLGLRVGIGALSGAYTSRVPHVSTGRADYFGTVVNRAARIAAAAHGGQVLLGSNDIEKPLPLGVQLMRLGAYDLKGVEKPIVLHELRVPAVDTGLSNFENFPLPKTKRRVGN